MAQFLRQNRLQNLTSRDASGWSAMCYAAIAGDCRVLEALLAKGGDVNDRSRWEMVSLWGKNRCLSWSNTPPLRKIRTLDYTGKHIPLLSISTRYEHLDAWHKQKGKGPEGGSLRMPLKRPWSDQMRSN